MLTQAEVQEIEGTEWTEQSVRALPLGKALRYASHPRLTEAIRQQHGRRPLVLKDGFDLFPHQARVVKWMGSEEGRGGSISFSTSLSTTKCMGGIIHLSMGLGKSIIAMVHALSSPPGAFPTLIVASKAVMAEWRDEVVMKFLRPADQGRVLFLHKDFMDKAELESVDRAKLGRYDVVITSYDACKTAFKEGNYVEDIWRERQNARLRDIVCRSRAQADRPGLTGLHVIYGTPWARVVCDESQRFGNPSTVTYRAMMGIHGGHKWCLTGTPVRNYGNDLFSQFRFLGYLGTATPSEWKRYGKQRMHTHQLLSRVMTMNHVQAGIQLPEVHYVNCPLTFQDPREQECYDYVRGKVQAALRQYQLNINRFDFVLVWFLRLRQVAIAPFLVCEESKRGKSAADTVVVVEDTHPLNDFIHDPQSAAGIQSTKVTEVVRLVKEVIPPTEKVLVFSMFTSCLDLVEKAFAVHCPAVSTAMIDGDVSLTQRQHIRNAFKKPDGTRVLFMTYKVGGEGLNLTEATRVIFMEPWWTDAVHSQALARAWRLGQQHPVFAYFICMRGSVEEHVFKICRKKLDDARQFLGDDAVNTSAEEIYQFGNGTGAGGLTADAIGQMIL